MTTSVWARVRRIWVRAGAVTLVVFPVWMLIAFRATSHARAALTSDGRTTVVRGTNHWRFQPTTSSRRTGLLFFPGAPVDPVAYAPLLHDVSSAGYTAVLIEVPRLPRSARAVPIAGGNHSQFGYYGFQLGDWPATIRREDQQQLTRDALVAALRAADKDK